MSIPSQKSTGLLDSPVALPLKAPTRERGRLRVAALLQAAASVFARTGFDNATMTEVAAAAKSSIGSLYQFFPTKESLARELVRIQMADLALSLEAIHTEADQLATDALSERLCFALIRFRDAHPSFAILVETPGASPEMADGVRRNMRAQLSTILRSHFPQLDAGHATAMAAMVQQIMKSAVQINAEPDPGLRASALNELCKMMYAYLSL